MPKFLRCYYGDCPSDNSIDPKIIFYKFPKDIERCRMWVKNCNNQELTEMWEKTPDKVATLRICQKHFLPQFLGSSSRLVGHAVPNPMDTEIDPEEFMQTCAGLKCNSGINYTVINGTIQTGYTVNNNGVKQGVGESIVITNPMTAMQSIRIPTNNQPGAHFFVINDPAGMDADAFEAMNIDYAELASVHSNTMTPSTSRQTGRYLNNSANKSSTPMMNRGNVTSFQLNGRTVSMMMPFNANSGTIDRNHHDQQIQAYKQKVRFYQRKLAVTNHRYQKIKTQVGGRSKKVRLLETLKMCKGDFDPCVFEIFKRQVKGKSKHGNRWSDDVKAFAATIYLRSKAAYKQIRKKIDLPSDSILKRYINESADAIAKYDEEFDALSTPSTPTPKQNDPKDDSQMNVSVTVEDVSSENATKITESHEEPTNTALVSELDKDEGVEEIQCESSSGLNENVVNNEELKQLSNQDDLVDKDGVSPEVVHCEYVSADNCSEAEKATEKSSETTDNKTADASSEDTPDMASTIAYEVLIECEECA